MAIFHCYVSSPEGICNIGIYALAIRFFAVYDMEREKSFTFE